MVTWILSGRISVAVSIHVYLKVVLDVNQGVIFKFAGRRRVPLPQRFSLLVADIIKVFKIFQHSVVNTVKGIGHL